MLSGSKFSANGQPIGRVFRYFRLLSFSGRVVMESSTWLQSCNFGFIALVDQWRGPNFPHHCLSFRIEIRQLYCWVVALELYLSTTVICVNFVFGQAELRSIFVVSNLTMVPDWNLGKTKYFFWNRDRNLCKVLETFEGSNPLVFASTFCVCCIK